MSRQANQTAWEYASEAGILDGLRFYLERLAFTRRGNFAFVVGMLYMIYDMVSHAVTTGTPSADAPVYLSNTSLAPNVMAGIDGVLTVLVGVTAAVVVLMLLDLYEHEVGISIDADH